MPEELSTAPTVAISAIAPYRLGARRCARATGVVLAATLLFTGGPAQAAVPQGWSIPVDISDPGPDSNELQIVAAPDGTVAAVWYQLDGLNNIIQASASADHGLTWSAPVDLSAGGQTAQSPQITATVDGALTAVWSRFDGANNIIQSSTSTDRGTTWTTAVNVSIPGRSSIEPQIVAAPDSALTAVWSRSDGVNKIVQASTSVDRGVTWGAPTNLSAVGQDAESPQVVTAPDGTLTAIWSRFDGANKIIQTSTSTDHGTTWTSPVNLSTPGQPAIGPQIASAPDGTISAVWGRWQPSGYMAQASTSTDHGATWTNPADLTTASGTAFGLQVTAASDGTFAAIWSRHNAGTFSIHTSSSTDRGVTWSGPATLSPVGPVTEGPQIAGAPDGTLTAVWAQSDGSDRVIRTRSSTDRGATWSSPANISPADSLGSYAEIPQLAATPDGALTAVWRAYVEAGSVIQSSFAVTAPTITSATPPAPVVGTAYSFQVTAGGSPAPGLTISGGVLPAGLTMSAGLISGTPSTSGDYTFTITASNGTVPDATTTYTITVGAVAAPVIPSTPAVISPLPKSLAHSGAEISAPVPVGALVAVVLGTALVLVSRRHSDKESFSGR